jgi:hypothetical protein
LSRTTTTREELGLKGIWKIASYTLSGISYTEIPADYTNLLNVEGFIRKFIQPEIEMNLQASI